MFILEGWLNHVMSEDKAVGEASLRSVCIGRGSSMSGNRLGATVSVEAVDQHEG